MKMKNNPFYKQVKGDDRWAGLINIYINPTKEEYDNLLEKYRSIKGFVEPLIIWDGNSAHHKEIAYKLNIKPKVGFAVSYEGEEFYAAYEEGELDVSFDEYGDLLLQLINMSKKKILNEKQLLEILNNTEIGSYIKPDKIEVEIAMS